MADNVYNGAAARTAVIAAGTRFYRVGDADASYPPNSYNPSPRELGDPRQGRFDPFTSDLGGYIYVAESISGAVAEGVLRNRPVPRSGLVPRLWLAGRVVVQLVLEEDVVVARVDGPHAASVNLDAGLLGSRHGEYSDCRKTATQILRADETVRGLRYSCRNNQAETAVLLITRDGPGPVLTVDSVHHVLDEKAGRDLIVGTLRTEYGLRFAGT